MAEEIAQAQAIEPAPEGEEAKPDDPRPVAIECLEMVMAFIDPYLGSIERGIISSRLKGVKKGIENANTEERVRMFGLLVRLDRKIRRGLKLGGNNRQAAPKAV